VLFLNANERQDPTRVFHHLFSDFNLFELKDLLWDMLNVSLTTDDGLFSDTNDRKTILLFTQEITRCLEAVRVFIDLQKVTSISSDPNEPAVKYRDIDSLSEYDLSAALEYYERQRDYFAKKMNDSSEIILKIIKRFLLRQSS